MSKKISAAWQHFTVVEDGKNAKCNHCHRTVVIANGSTGNMFRHLKYKHPSLSVEKLNRCKTSLLSNKIKKTPISTETDICSEEIIVPITLMETSHINTTNIITVPNSSENVINTKVQTTVVEVPQTTTENVTNATILPNVSTVSVDSNQQPVVHCVVQPIEENERQNLEKQLLKTIVKNLIPFSIVEQEEFISFVRTLNSSYTLPSQKTLSNELLDSMHKSTVDELKNILQDTDVVALTADSWISVSKKYFIAFSVHYLNKNLELKSNYLQCFSSRQKFNRLDIALFMEELATNWNLDGKILAVVTDGSEEMKKAVNNCDLNHIPCFAFILDQIVETGLKVINPFVFKIRNVVQYFISNSVASSNFYNIQQKIGLVDYKLVRDSPSRWDTTFNMLTAFLENKVPLQTSIAQMQLSSFMLSSADFHYLESIIKILLIFNSVKISMCSENNLSLSKIPHMINFISKNLDNVLEDSKLPSDIIKMGNTMKDILKRFDDLETNELINQAVLLDPRLKKQGLSNSFLEEACLALQQNVAAEREEITKEKNEVPTSPIPERNEMESDSEYFMDMWSEFESKDPSPAQSHTAAATVELDAFFNDLNLPIEDNPLNYWANISNQNKFPALFELAKRVLCIPATSVPSQQLYSKDGHIFFKKRKYLSSVKADKILFLHHNLQ